MAPVALAVLAGALFTASPAVAATPPVVGHLDVTAGITSGGARVEITGQGLRHVRAVVFGSHRGSGLHVLSATALLVTAPKHGAGRVQVRVITSAGESAPTSAAWFTYEPLSFTGTHLNGGRTAAQERSVASHYRAKAASLERVRTAARSSRWTLAMGRSAVRRAKAWLGLPYSWAGGTTSGPSTGVCDYGHGGGGWYDCRIWGFDCSGLVLYGWSRYESLVHYAATQYTQAGRFHPRVDELQPGDLLFYSDTGSRSHIHHVAMYVGHGKVIQAQQSGFEVAVTPRASVLPGQYYGATRPMSTGKQGAGPTVTKLSRRTVHGGEQLTVRGRNFGTASVVKFGTHRTYAFQVISSTKIVVTVPAHSRGRLNVRVGNAWGVSKANAATHLTYAA